MVLYHITPRRNMTSIDKHGLLPERATGKEQAVHLVTRGLIPWGLAHTATKPDKAPLTKLVVYRVEVSRSKVRRFRRGLWRSFERLWPVGCEPASVYTLAYPDEPEPDWDRLAAEAEALDALTNGHFLG
jgi:hypothetical protein